MSAVGMRMRAELRARWRAWLTLSLLVALFFAPALSAFAGARRTNNVYTRFLKKQNAWDVIVLDASVFASILWKPDFDALEHLPYVRSSVRIVTGNLAGLSFAGDLDGKYGTVLNKAKLVEGRLPRPDAPNEVAVPYFQATAQTDSTIAAGQRALAHAKIGSRVRLLEPCEPGSSPACQGSPPVIERFVTVVGRTISPFDFRPNEFDAMGFVSTNLLKELSASQPGASSYSLPAIALQFRHPSDIARFDRDVREMTRGKAVLPLRQAVNERAINSSARLQGMAVGLLAVFAGLTAILLMSQTLARQTVLESDEHPALRSLGMSRVQTFTLGVARAALIASVGAVLAGLAAWLSSGLFPFGVFRLAEPSPGLRFDVVPMVLGPLAVIIVAIAAVAVPSWRSAVVQGDEPSTPSRIAAGMGRAGMPSTAVAGVRLAFERGRGRTAVPVRSTITIVTLGVAAMVAALTVSSSIAFLLDTPVLYGKTWDKVVNYPDGRPLDSATMSAIAAEPQVRDLAYVDTGAPFLVDGRRVGGLVVNNVKGSMFPPVLEGRSPAASDEIALGTKTLRALHKHVDLQHPQTVRLGVEGIPGSIEIKIVGRAVVPPVNNYSRFGEGLLAKDLQPLAKLLLGRGDVPEPTDAIVRFQPGTDPQVVIARVATKFPGLHIGDDFARRPSDVVDFGRVKGMPLILSGVLALIGAAALTHAIASAIRRRRRDLAILKTIGFVRAQVRRAVAWQSSTLIVVAVAVGIPLGIAGGRALWDLIAGSVGVQPSARVPALWVALLAPIALILANVIATFPARTAAHTSPALVLRTE
jgi:ABC-type antimicrobial peptide transport system permease subunit